MKLGKWNILRIDRIKDVGAYLTDGIGLEDGTMDVLLPKNQIPEDVEIGDNVRVFLYRDSEDRPIATTREVKIELGEMKRLKVKSVTNIGAFLDWGLNRDLFLPFKEQTTKVEQERSYLVRLYIDKSGRLAASMKLDRELKANTKFKKGDHVKGTVYNIKPDFGAFVAVEEAEVSETQEAQDIKKGENQTPIYSCSGLIHSSELFENLHVGDLVECRVVKAREDGKLDLAMREEIPVQMERDAQMVLDIIKSYGGKLPFNDKADAAVIKREFGLSKNAFKRAVGRLLKQKKIEIGESSITII
ncbi:MAG: RNA-binding protein [Eubacterium sp.]|nr:RNA-binding protein [Eubacterium sp.]